MSRIPELHDIYVNEYKINQAENYCYLSVDIGEKNLQEIEIRSKVAK